MIDRLRQAMSAAGYDLGATELLDVLWLARAMEGRAVSDGGPGESGECGETATREPTGDGDGPVNPVRSAASAGTAGQPAPAPSRTDGLNAPGGPGGHDDPTASTDPSRANEPDTVDGPPRRALYAMGSQGGRPGADRARPARVPGGRALPDAQQLGRALRPLRRSRDHPHHTVTDVDATVRLAAETGFLDIVLRPDQERRWSAVLLVDCSPSMQVWGPLAAELRTLLTRSTAFRSVQVHPIDPQDPSGPVSPQQSAGAAVTFLLTDGTSPEWRGPQAVRALAAWGRRGPVAVLNPLPRRLWRGTALDARPRLLAAPGEFDPLGRLVVCDPLSGERDPEADGLLALPVLHPTASALQQWSGLLTRPGVPHLIETALLDGAPSPTPPPRPHGSAEELLTHFRGAFSPEAYRLAVRLSAIRPLTTPLMQLVRTATMPDTGPTHVAEILLGGLLERTDRTSDAAAAQTLDRALGAPPPGQLVEPVYDFRPGVRELLFSGLGAEQAVDVVEAVGRSLEPYMGRLPDFPVLMGDEDGELRLHASARAFAVLASPVLERMGGVVPEQRVTAGQRVAAEPPLQRPLATPPPTARPELPPDAPQTLRFTVLGPVRAWRGGTPCALGSPQQRALLAALLLRRGRPATAAELVTDLWGTEPPPRARAALRTYAARLRRALDEDGELLVSERGGYALRHPDGSPPALDLDEAERLIARSGAAADPDESRRLRDAALALWDGEPLAGLPGPFAAAHRGRLARWRTELLARAYVPQEPGAWPVPQALPLAPEPFIGRAEEIAQLVAGLTRPGEAPPCWAIHGPAGSGKTALALRVAHEVAEHFPDGQLFVDLRGTEPTDLSLNGAQLAERRALIVLDGAPDAEEPLTALLSGLLDTSGTSGTPRVAVLITSRRRLRLRALTGTVALDRLPVPVPAPAPAQPQSTLPEQPSHGRLDGERLTASARRACALLAVPESAEISLGAAVALFDVPAERGQSLVDDLLAAGLLGKTAPGRYRRAGELARRAREIAEQELSEAEREEALARLLTWYLALGRQVHEARYPGERLPRDLVRNPTSGLPPLKDGTQALAAWAAETPQALSLVRQTVVDTPRFVRGAADLLLLAQVTADSGAPAAAFEPAAQAVAARASLDGAVRAEGRARVALADAYAAMGKFAEAEPEAREAARLARAADDQLVLFRAPFAAGITAFHQRRHDDAERHLTAAWECCRDRGDELGEAAVLAALARVWAATGNSNDAVLFAKRSVGIYRRSGGGTPRLGHGLYALSEALSADGRHADALRELFQALPLFEEDHQRLWAARTRCRTAEAMVSLIRPSEAAAAAQDAAKRLLVPGGERWRADALMALGHAETALGRKQSAQAHWREALAVYEAFGAPEAREVRVLLRDRTAKTAPSAAGSRRKSVSRTADTASTGTVLRDLTAAVRTLRDQLRIQGADQGADQEGALAAAGSTAQLGLEALETIEAELARRVADFDRTGQVPRAELSRLRADLESVTSSEALREPGAGAADAVGAVRALSRHLA